MMTPAILLRRVVLFSVLISFTALVSSVLAQDITGISGTVSQGSLLIINGSGFGERTRQAPYCFEDFEGQTHQLDVNASPGYYKGRLSQAQRYAGSQSIELRHGDPGIDFELPAYRQGWAYYRFPRELQGGDEIFMSFWERWSWGCWWCDDPEHSAPGGPATTSYQIKNWRVSSGNHYVTPPDIVHSSQSDCNDWGTPGFHPRFMVTSMVDTIWYSNIFPKTGGGYEHTLPHHTWIQWEVMIRQSSPDTNDGANVVWIARNGKSAVIANEVNVRTHRAGDPGFNKVSLGDWIDSFGRSTTQYYDNFYFDMGWSRVVIGNNPDYDSCTVRDIQPYTAWSNTSITIRVNAASFANGQTAYLFFVGPSGRPADMQTVEISSGGMDSVSPAAPSSLRLGAN